MKHAPHSSWTRRSPWTLIALSAALVVLWGQSALESRPLAPEVPHPSNPAAPTVTVDPSATRKVCQVTGEVDRQTGRRTVNATESNYRFWGTDLGASFQHDGKLVFLFGDTHVAPGLQRAHDRDLVALSDDTDPEDCLSLSIGKEEDGGFRPLNIPTVDGGAFSVPTGGFSANGKMYVYASTDSAPGKPMARTVLAASSNGGRDFERLYDVSTEKFINVAPVTVEPGHVAGLPTAGRGVLLWGSGTYRRSDTHLAYLPADAAEDRSQMRYFAGTDPVTGTPQWSHAEADAKPLLQQACVGELSVAWNPYLNRWTMLYNCEDGQGGARARSRILVRTAEQPWGPWSEPQALFDAERDGGYCAFMHTGPGVHLVAGGGAPCPAVGDPHNLQTAGDPYAPYVIAPFTRGVPGSHSDIYFLMSTWNPYTVVLMKATLRLDGRPAVHTAQWQPG